MTNITKLRASEKFGVTDIETLKNVLTDYLIQRNEEYRSGKPTISDAEYDNLVEELKAINPDSSFLNTVEPEIIEGKPKIFHDQPMLSTEKTYTDSGLQKFINKIIETGSSIGIPADEIKFQVTPKLDGIGVKVEKEITTGEKILLSRGDGLYGYDISDAFAKGIICPSGAIIEGPGEIVLQKRYYDKFLSEHYGHPRNICQGIVASDSLNPDFQKALQAKAVHFVPYTRLTKWVGNGKELLADAKKIKTDVIKNIEYPIDGVVIETTNQEIKNKLGATNHFHRWQIALKTQGETGIVTVTDIKYQVGRTGVQTPVIEFDPIVLSGATISKVTAHNAGYIQKNKIGIGAQLEIIRSGEVIPAIIRVVSQSETPKIPTNCSCCNEPVEWEKDLLKCNNMDCPAQLEKKIEHWFSTLNSCNGFGSKTIQKITRYGVKNIEEIYECTEQDFCKMGFGPKQASNLFQALKISIVDPIEDWKFMAAFGIPNLGKGDSKKLFQQIPFEQILEIEDPDEITKIKGFGKITANSIIQHLEKYLPTIRYMQDMGIKLKKTPFKQELSADYQQVLFQHKFLGEIKKQDSELNSSASNLADMNIVFTGKMQLGSRNEMEQQAELLGANPQHSITKKTNFLVCGENVGQSKINKAVKYNVKIITEQEYLNMFDDIKNQDDQEENVMPGM